MISDETRFEAAEQIIDEVVKIAGNSAVQANVPEVEQRLAFLKKNRMVVLVPPENCIHENWGAKHNAISGFLPRFYRFSLFLHRLFPGKEPQNMGFCPLFSDDASINASVKYHFLATKIASYGAESNSVYINMSCGETLRTFACAFIHELGHAKLAYDNGRVWGKVDAQKEERQLREELEMWSVDARLILALGGPKYQFFVKCLAQEMICAWSQGMSFLCLPGIGTALDDCLGLPTTDAARLNRDGSLQMYCALSAADLLPDGCRMEQKLSIIRQAHESAYREKEALIQELQS